MKFASQPATALNSVVYLLCTLSASFNAIRPAVERIGQKLSYVLKEYI